MSITTDIAVMAVVAAVVGGVAWKYTSTLEENTKLKDRVKVLEPVVEAHVESGEVKNEQATSTQAAEAASAKLSNDVNRLRKSVESLKAPAANSIEACNKSLAAAGGVLGECTVRYTEVARKAELLKVDLTAMDKHVDLIEGLVSDITGMEPLK